MKQPRGFAITAMALAFVMLVSTTNVEANIYEDDESGGMDHHLWLHELKKTYCQAIVGNRIYKVENLAVHCAGKVSFFDEWVS